MTANSVHPFGGRTLRREAVGESTLSITEYRPGTLLERHCHQWAYFCFVERGAFRERTRRGTAEHSANGLIYHPPDDPHEDTFHSRPSRCFNVELAPSLFSCVGNRRLEPDFAPQPEVIRLVRKLSREFRDEPPSSMVVQGLIYQMVGETFERAPAGSGSGPSWLARVRAGILDRYPEPLTVTELAAEAGVHPVHLSRMFKAQFGETVGETLRSLRIRRAAELLRSSSISIAEIAQRCGFADQSHLGRAFRRAIGTTPGVYRSRLR